VFLNLKRAADLQMLFPTITHVKDIALRHIDDGDDNNRNEMIIENGFIDIFNLHCKNSPFLLEYFFSNLLIRIVGECIMLLYVKT
jgi:hypothetical protein